MHDERMTDRIQAGWSAYGSDGEKIGDIEEVGPNYILVTKGLIFVTDLYVPVSAIRQVDSDEGRVHLTVEKSAVEDQGWNEPPASDDAYGTTAGATALSGSGETWGQGADRDAGSEGLGHAGRDSDLGDRDTLRVPVHEESLRAERTTEQAGEVQVGKRVVEEQRELDVPVTREQVEVRRVATDRTAGADETAFSDGDTIRVPVTAETVHVSKEPRVVEEIEITKRPVTETQRVSETVRREEVDVEETGGVLTGAGASMSGTGHEFDDTTSSTRGTGYGDESLDDDRSGRGGRAENVAEAGGAGAGALGGAAVGGAIGGPPGAVVGGVAGAAGGAILGDEAEERATDEDDDRRR